MLRIARSSRTMRSKEGRDGRHLVALRPALSWLAKVRVSSLRIGSPHMENLSLPNGGRFRVSVKPSCAAPMMLRQDEWPFDVVVDPTGGFVMSPAEVLRLGRSASWPLRLLWPLTTRPLCLDLGACGWQDTGSGSRHPTRRSTTDKTARNPVISAISSMEGLLCSPLQNDYCGLVHRQARNQAIRSVSVGATRLMPSGIRTLQFAQVVCIMYRSY